MAPNNIDNHFRKIIEGSEAHYSEKASGSKEKIWDELAKDNKLDSQRLIKLLMAASIAILLGFSFSQYYSNNRKSKQISALKNQIEFLQKQNNFNQLALQNSKLELKPEIKTDTVEVEKIKKVKQIVTVVKYNTDTVYITPKTEVSQPDQLADTRNIQTSGTIQQTIKSANTNDEVEFLLSENDIKTKEKPGLGDIIMGFAKSKSEGRRSNKNSNVQSSIKQFLSPNIN